MNITKNLVTRVRDAYAFDPIGLALIHFSLFCAFMVVVLVIVDAVR